EAVCGLAAPNALAADSPGTPEATAADKPAAAIQAATRALEAFLLMPSSFGHALSNYKNPPAKFAQLIVISTSFPHASLSHLELCISRLTQASECFINSF